MQHEIDVVRVHGGAHSPQINITDGASGLIIYERDIPEFLTKLGECLNIEIPPPNELRK